LVILSSSSAVEKAGEAMKYAGAKTSVTLPVVVHFTAYDGTRREELAAIEVHVLHLFAQYIKTTRAV
jgi:hypothetical protein